MSSTARLAGHLSGPNFEIQIEDTIGSYRHSIESRSYHMMGEGKMNVQNQEIEFGGICPTELNLTVRDRDKTISMMAQAFNDFALKGLDGKVYRGNFGSILYLAPNGMVEYCDNCFPDDEK